MSVSYKIVGLDELLVRIRRLDERMRSKILKKAMRRGARPIVKAAREKAPRGAKVRTRKTKNGETVELKPLHRSIGVRSARARRGGETDSIKITASVPHAHLNEFGTGPRFHKETGKAVGSMPATPFMRPALDENEAKAKGIIALELAAGIEAEVKG